MNSTFNVAFARNSIEETTDQSMFGTRYNGMQSVGEGKTKFPGF